MSIICAYHIEIVACGDFQIFLNPLSPTRQNFFLHYQYDIKQTSNESEEKYQLGDYWLIQYQILQIRII